MAGEMSWTAVFARSFERGIRTFVIGGPSVGKTYFLRDFICFLRSRLKSPGSVVVLAPTGSAAKTAKGVTYLSYFGFTKKYKMQCANLVDEAARFLSEDWLKPIGGRLAKVEVLLLDEISMVSADILDVIYELFRQSRRPGSPPFVMYTFGDFSQLRPTFGALAFTARCWGVVFGKSMLELTHMHWQEQPDFVAAFRDACFGQCTTVVQKLMDECTVDDEAYKALECSVIHLMPRHTDVFLHNDKCLKRQCPVAHSEEVVALDGVKVDPNRNRTLRDANLGKVSAYSRDASLMDCVVPRRVQHCRGVRVMLACNVFLGLGLFHGSIGEVRDYDNDGTPVLRIENHQVVHGTWAGKPGVRKAGADWVEVLCPPIDFEARILAHPGVLAVRGQVPFVLGWAITVNWCQILTLTEAVLDVGEAFGAGMVQAAMSRVPDTRPMYVRSFSGRHVLADPEALRLYQVSRRLQAL